MLTYQKQSLPVHFLKFGVDDHGLIVPRLRQGKVSTLRLELLVRRVQLTWKGFTQGR